MNIKTIFASALLGLSLLAANAVANVTSQAYEVDSKDFVAPVTTNGGATFKPCSDCDRQTVRVAAGTRYSINGRAVRLEEFRKAAAQVRGREGVSITVLHHLESDTIELIDIVY